jgi:hypothetical protein
MDAVERIEQAVARIASVTADDTWLKRQSAEQLALLTAELGRFRWRLLKDESEASGSA